MALNPSNSSNLEQLALKGLTKTKTKMENDEQEIRNGLRVRERKQNDRVRSHNLSLELFVCDIGTCKSTRQQTERAHTTAKLRRTGNST